MAEEQKPVEQESTPSPDAGTPKEPSIKEILAQLESIKAAQSGSDKKVKELTGALTQKESEIEELKKAKMSADEKIAYELKQREELLARKDAEIRSKEVALEKTNILTELQIPIGFMPRVSGATHDEIMADAKKFKDEIGVYVTQEVNRRLAAGGDKPKAGNGEVPKVTMEQFATMTRDQAANMSPADFEKLLNSQ